MWLTLQQSLGNRRFKNICPETSFFADRPGLKCFIVYLVWLMCGTLFYAYAPRSNLGFQMGFFMAINIGYSVGTGFPAEDYKNEYLLFSSFYVLMGSSFVGVAISFFADKISEDRDNWFTNLKQKKKYEDAFKSGSSVWVKIKAMFVQFSAQIRAVSLWILWILIMTMYSRALIPGWNWNQAQYFAISSLSTGGHYTMPPDTTPTWLFFITGIFMMLGVPVMAVAMVSMVKLFAGDDGDLQSTKETVCEEVDIKELVMLQKFGLEDGDGVIDRAEWIILCMVRMGTDPNLIQFISDLFCKLDADGGGTLSVEEITRGKYRAVEGKIQPTENCRAHSSRSLLDNPASTFGYASSFARRRPSKQKAAVAAEAAAATAALAAAAATDKNNDGAAAAAGTTTAATAAAAAFAGTDVSEELSFGGLGSLSAHRELSDVLETSERDDTSIRDDDMTADPYLDEYGDEEQPLCRDGSNRDKNRWASILGTGTSSDDDDDEGDDIEKMITIGGGDRNNNNNTSSLSSSKSFNNGTHHDPNSSSDSGGGDPSPPPPQQQEQRPEEEEEDDDDQNNNNKADQRSKRSSSMSSSMSSTTTTRTGGGGGGGGGGNYSDSRNSSSNHRHHQFHDEYDSGHFSDLTNGSRNNNDNDSHHNDDNSSNSSSSTDSRREENQIPHQPSDDVDLIGIL